MENKYFRLIQRRDTKANWEKVNPVLKAGEFGYCIDSMDFKIGNDIDRWNELPYQQELMTVDWDSILRKPDIYSKQEIDAIIGSINNELSNI